MIINDQLREEYCNYCLDRIPENSAFVNDRTNIYHPECFELLSHYHYYDEFKEEFKD